ELTGAGATLLRSVAPLLARLDASVRQIRMARSRAQVSVSTFPSFASLWLMPRLIEFERAHPALDIRISATDRLVDPDDPELDLALRHCRADRATAGATRLFGEVLSPVIGARLADAIRRGEAAPLKQPAELAGHTLLDMDDGSTQAAALGWAAWLAAKGLDRLAPKRWISTNFTHQQIQAALAGQGVALARMALVHDQIARGELVEPFGAAGRMTAPLDYWLIPLPGARLRPELRAFITWVRGEAAATRSALGEAPGIDAPQASQ
nr:LysR substrate-binding domain-containing protein [Aquabacterium sp.]